MVFVIFSSFRLDIFIRANPLKSSNVISRLPCLWRHRRKWLTTSVWLGPGGVDVIVIAVGAELPRIRKINWKIYAWLNNLQRTPPPVPFFLATPQTPFPPSPQGFRMMIELIIQDAGRTAILPQGCSRTQNNYLLMCKMKSRGQSRCHTRTGFSFLIFSVLSVET